MESNDEIIKKIKEMIFLINHEERNKGRYFLLNIPYRLLRELVRVSNRLSKNNCGDVEKFILEILTTYLKFNFEIRSNETPNIISWKNIYLTSPSDNIHCFTQWYLIANRKRERCLVMYDYDSKKFYSPNIDYNRFKLNPKFKTIFWMPLHISPYLPTHRSIDDKLIKDVYYRDNYTCKNCGISIYDNPHLELHIDHVFPYSKGGYHEKDNLQVLCSNCNSLKKDNITQEIQTINGKLNNV